MEEAMSCASIRGPMAWRSSLLQTLLDASGLDISAFSRGLEKRIARAAPWYGVGS